MNLIKIPAVFDAMATHEVSIIIPNYNKAPFLVQTLDSLISQTWKGWEAFVIDDGSTDRSLETIAEFQQRDPRIVSLPSPEPGKGACYCRNRGLDKASGKYIIFLDSDDLLAPICLEKRIAFMESYPGLDFAVFPLEVFTSSGKVPGKKVWQPQRERALERFLSHDLPWQTMQPIFKKDFLLKNHFRYPEHMPRLQDVFFHTEILLSNPAFEVSAGEPDCFFRVDEDRKVFGQYDFYKNWVTGVNLYVGHFRKVVHGTKQRQLYLTVLDSLSQLNHARISGRISSTEYSKLSKELLEGQGSSRYMKTLKAYSFVSGAMPFHIRGFNWSVNRLLKLL